MASTCGSTTSNKKYQAPLGFFLFFYITVSTYGRVPPIVIFRQIYDKLVKGTYRPLFFETH